MPESSALPLQVAEVLARGWTVITSNQRAARTLRRAFGLQQRAQARTSWEPPAILAWESWLTSLHHQMLLAGRTADLLLNGSQEHALWLSVISSDVATSSLRPLDALADAAAEAWALLHAFRGRSHLGRYPGNSDTRVFARWTYDFERRLKRGQYLTVAQLPERLAEAVRRNEVTLPAGVLLVGFDSQSPAQQALLAVIAEAGAEQGTPLQQKLDSFGRILVWAEIITAGAFARMHIEEYLLVRKYPEYREYKRRVKKLVPFVY